jgi:hypothetical protein
VVKKWLNIKHKVNDFSEDEYTETESEDDGMVLKCLLVTVFLNYFLCLIMFCQFSYSFLC